MSCCILEAPYFHHDNGRFVQAVDWQEIEEAQGQIQARMRQAARLQARSAQIRGRILSRDEER